MPRRLTTKEEAFAAARAAGASQTDAYRASHPESRASDKTARQEGSKINQRPAVRLRIQQLVDETRRRIEAAVVERVTAPAVRAATSVVENAVAPAVRAAVELALTQQWVRQELVENVKMAKQAAPILDRKGEPTGEYRVDLAAANKALELLGKDIGMFQTRADDKTHPLDALDDEQVRALAAAVDEELGRRAAEAEDPSGPPGAQGGSGKPH